MSRLKLDVLGTKVARRVLFLFMAGAAVPVAVMALLSYTAISSQLREQAETRLGHLTGIQTQSILGRLSGFVSVARSSGALAVEALPAGGGSGVRPVALPPGLSGIGIEVDGERRPVAGSLGDLPGLTPEQESRLRAGGDVLLVDRTGSGHGPDVLVATPITASDGLEGRVWARIIGDSVWGPAVTQAADPSIDDMCVLDAASEPLFCLGGARSSLPARVPAPAIRTVNSGQAELRGDDGTRLVAWRDVYLGAAFSAPSWTVVVSQAEEAVYGAGDTFAYNLLLTLLIGLSAALLVTHVLVRRTMEPLRDLATGTRRLAAHELDARVQVRTDDEFGDLAASFNTMAERLGAQFHQLEARRAIDHAALTGSDNGRAVQALLEGVGGIVPGRTSALALIGAEAQDPVRLFIRKGGVGPARSVPTDPAGRSSDLGLDGPRLVAEAAELPEAFASISGEGVRLPLLVLPLRVRGVGIGAVAVEAPTTDGLAEGDSRRIQDLADQAAVALEKLRLDRELASMSWEALRALANAIDAKSAWTTGHSERVTNLSLVMGSELGLTEDDMNVVHRGGLLHDIGKIGVPAEILDHGGALDASMRAIMETHPEAGVRILEPIRAFRPILPIVLYHHERWDGSGYPAGLVGEDTPRLARLVAVADVFDAMVSARPYRPALDPEVVLDHISGRSGTDFDPEMVQALERVMRGGWSPPGTSTAETLSA